MKVVEMGKMKVMMLAFECNPEWPSLPVVAYKYALAMAEIADVTLVTQILNKENIEKAGIGKLKVDYIDIDSVAVPLDRMGKKLRGGNNLGWTTQVAFTYPTYLAFEWAVWRKYRAQLAAGAFDVIHRSTPMTQTLPSPIATWSKVPFVIGPLNGGLPWPAAFKSMAGKEKEWLRPLRGAYKHMPYNRATYANAACVLASFDHTINDLPPAIRPKVIDFPEVGIDPGLFSTTRQGARPVADQVTVLFVSRLVPLKLPQVILNAFARSKILRHHKLVFVGDGPEAENIRRIIAEEQLTDCVEMRGWLRQAEVGQLMRSAEILAFPSIKDLGAGVLVEAMACGMTCVAVDYGAAATLISDDRGVKIPLGSIEELSERYCKALEELVTDRDRLRLLGETAQAYTLERFPWQAKAAKTLEAYEWVVGGKKGEKPNFWM